LGTASLCLLLVACGDRAGQAPLQDRLAALRACSAALPAAMTRADRHLGTELQKLEHCMARRSLPGRATFDPLSNSLRYAYDPPTLRF